MNTSSVGAIAVADSDPNVIYVGMGEHAIRGVMTSHGDGVYKSTDAGRTWTHMGLPRSRAIARIRIHPTDPDRVYVAVQGAPYGRPTEERGIYRSRDGGATWDHVLYIGETAGASDLAMDPTNPRILYAAFWELLVPGIARLVTGRTLKQRTFVVHRAENRQKRLRLQAVALHPGTTIANYRFVLPATAHPI